MSTTAEKIAVMQAHEQGEQIEFYNPASGSWRPAPFPVWDWAESTYRVKPKEPVIKTVKMLCFLRNGCLSWRTESSVERCGTPSLAVRIPTEDKVITYIKEQS